MIIETTENLRKLIERARAVGKGATMPDIAAQSWY